MGANQYTPSTEAVRDHWENVGFAGTGEEFDRWFEQIRAEAKAEALEDFAKVIDAEERDQWIADGIRKPGAQIVAQRMKVLGKVARARAEQIKAAP